MFGLNNDCKCVIYRKPDIGTFFSFLSTLDIRYSDLPIKDNYQNMHLQFYIMIMNKICK